MLEKYESGASKDVYKVVTGDGWIELNTTKVVCGKITSKQIVAFFFFLSYLVHF